MSLKLEQFLDHIRIKMPNGEFRAFSDGAKDFARAEEVYQSEGKEFIYFHPRGKYPTSVLPFMKDALSKYWKNLSEAPNVQESDTTDGDSNSLAK